MITVDQAGESTITVASGANREVGPEEVAAACESAAELLVISAELLVIGPRPGDPRRAARRPRRWRCPVFPQPRASPA